MLIKINPVHPEESAITKAAQILRSGGLVAFPTETVYGLGANALDPEAVIKIFRAKGRPSDNPMIVHISEISHLEIIASEIPAIAMKLIDRFWPGPLTLILEKSSRVPYEITGGLETVAVRMPDNIVALSLIKTFGGPVAAPSANLSGRPSGTSGEHVYQDFSEKIDVILDSGPTSIGLESTVLDLSTKPPAILRPGAVTVNELEKVIGKVVVQEKGDMLKRSPGTRYRHYSPRAEVKLVSELSNSNTNMMIEEYLEKGKKLGLITRHSYPPPDNHDMIIKIMPQSLEEYARQMFAVLRELDIEGVDRIIIEEVEEEGIGIAIMDRLRRAAAN